MGPEGPNTTSKSEGANCRHRDEAWQEEVFEPGCDGWAAVVGVAEGGCGGITAKSKANVESRRQQGEERPRDMLALFHRTERIC